jgi:predicted nucleic acid-binding protein
LLAAVAARVVVPWPVYTEVDLLLRARGHAKAATAFGSVVRDGLHRLEAPTAAELGHAIGLLERYQDLGLDLPDATTAAMALARDAWALTWDFQHFRVVTAGRGQGIPLLVTEADLPGV